MKPDALAQKWREEAARLRRYNAVVQADLLATVADELEASLREEAEELLSLQQAATESGYSSRQLSRLAASGALPASGRKNAPRFRRGDLPRKAPPSRTAGPISTVRGISKEQIAQSIVNSKR